MKRLFLVFAILFSFTLNAYATATIGPSFSNISGAGGAVNAAKQGTNTLYVNGLTFSKVGGRPTMSVSAITEIGRAHV